MTLTTVLGTIHRFRRVHRVQVIHGEFFGRVPVESRRLDVLVMGVILLGGPFRISRKAFKDVKPPLVVSASEEGMVRK